jgi:hypothetical protein
MRNQSNLCSFEMFYVGRRMICLKFILHVGSQMKTALAILIVPLISGNMHTHPFTIHMYCASVS